MPTKQWRDNNKEKIQKERALYREHNRDKINGHAKAYYERNKKRISDYRKARRLRIKLGTVKKVVDVVKAVKAIQATQEKVVVKKVAVKKRKPVKVALKKQGGPKFAYGSVFAQYNPMVETNHTIEEVSEAAMVEMSAYSKEINAFLGRGCKIRRIKIKDKFELPASAWFDEDFADIAELWDGE
jgi:hypothetical protein